MEWLIKKIYTVRDVQKKVFYRSRLSEWLIRKTIYTVTNVQNIVSYRSSDLTSLRYNVNMSEVYQKVSYSEIRLVPKKRTERLAEDAGGRQRESGTGSDKERGSA